MSVSPVQNVRESVRASSILLAMFVIVAAVCFSGCSVSREVDSSSTTVAADTTTNPVLTSPVRAASPELPDVTGTPQQFYRQSGAPPYTQLDAVSADSTYGYSFENPIKIGGGFPNGGLAIYRYLNALLDPGDNPISYSRQGTCCPFESNPGLLGSGQGVLDVYLIQYDDLEQPVRLYFNTFASEKLLAPKGLRYLGET